MNAILAPNGRPARLQVRNTYEGGRYSPLRSLIPGGLQTATSDAPQATRREIAKRARYLWKNSPTIRGLVERIVTYTVGPGIRPIPSTSDPDWNERAKIYFNDWSRHADLRTGVSFSKLQRILLRWNIVDGELFAVQTFNSDGRPRLQLVESQACAFPDGTTIPPESPDGITLDSLGRPKTYTFLAPDKKSTTVRAASEVIHALDVERADQFRGVSLLAAAVNCAIDLDDILLLEKAAVKTHSARTDTIATGSGELAAEALIASNGADETEAAMRYYRTVFGPEAKVIKTGDTWTPFVSQRPSPSWQGFIDFLTQTICLAANVPPSILLQLKVGGADTRRDLAAAARAFELYGENVIDWSQLAYEYVLGSAIADGPLLNAPADWSRAVWQLPKAITVDAGREAKSDRDDVACGLLTRREYFGRWGQDWREEADQVLAEAQLRIHQAKQLAQDENIELELALQLIDRTLTPAVTEPDEPSDDSEPEPTSTS